MKVEVSSQPPLYRNQCYYFTYKSNFYYGNKSYGLNFFKNISRTKFAPRQKSAFIIAYTHGKVQYTEYFSSLVCLARPLQYQ